MIDEFDDVSKEEKVFMKLWNKFVKTHMTVADKNMPEICLSFIKNDNYAVVSNSLRQNLLLHLFNLWDHCVISSEHINILMGVYDSHALTIK